MIGVTFFGTFGTFAGHSISLGVNNGTLDGGLYAQLIMKKHDCYKDITDELQKGECYKLWSYR